MERGPLIYLLDTIGKHPELSHLMDSKEAKGHFFRLLNPIEVKPSRRFYKPVEGNEYPLVAEPDKPRIVSVDMVLRNQVAESYPKSGYNPSIVKKMIAQLIEGNRAYYPVMLSRMLRADPAILAMLVKASKDLVSRSVSDSPSYSLLGRIDTFDQSKTKIERRPVALIPGADMDKIIEWETANKQYLLKEPSGRVIPITREQYFGI